ncbi:Protein O-GlcNAcase [Holothuria leucospilota]|uniref:protein O-GlcNAcase n=1 Tax=Holothuria leucospilota TaxID=206669 RepID=A0A9Q1BI12_HOLLE|nr:Protein O-GlcNAcase [Holothuria leucospilota]
MLFGDFLCGVIEGFYGRPWTMEQRKDLFAFMNRTGLNTYIYAPKDDCKHRAFWRDLYSVEEAERLTSLIEEAKENNVLFVYALSPGLDITFSNAKEVTCLKRKLEQVNQFGCEAFALLFDDIDKDMCVADQEVFQSFAQAQVSITNEVYQYLGQPTFLFCPTEYCATRADPDIRKSEYLTTVGNKLLPAINMMWTGPKVVSKEITVESIKELTEVIKRKPVIWDNIHANDYDQKRLFLGPFQGRSTDLRPYLNGFMTNPNCEYNANFMAIHTLGSWFKDSEKAAGDTTRDSTIENPTISAEIKLETEGENLPLQRNFHGNYNPKLASQAAIADWMKLFMEAKDPQGRSLPPLVLNHPEVLPLPVPPLPSINTCMAVTQTTTTVFGTDLPETVSEELQKVKESLVGIGNETLKPPIVNSLVASSDEPVEPMECNGNTTIALSSTPPKVATKDSINLSTSTIVNKTADTSRMQVDDVTSKAPEKVQTEQSAEGMLDSEMQVDTGSPNVSSENFTVDNSKGETPEKPRENPRHVIENVEEEDVCLLVELFYLPYEHGSKAISMLEEVHWLKSNAYVLHQAKKTKQEKAKAEQWKKQADHFLDFCQDVKRMHKRILNVPNRSLLYDLYPYIWDMEGIVSMVGSYIKWLEKGHVPRICCSYMEDALSWCTKNHQEAFMSGDLEPWVFRGGLTGEFERMLPLEGAGDLFYKTPPPVSNKVYTIRPYLHTDEPSIYKVCRMTCDDGADGSDIFPDHPDLIGDKLVGHFLTLSPEYCFVVTDNEEIVGYAVATKDSQSFRKQVDVSWVTSMKEKYPHPEKAENLSPAEEIIVSFHDSKVEVPAALSTQFPSLLRLDILPKVQDVGVTKNLLACVLSALKSNGSCGAHVEVLVGERNQLEFYTKLGFFELPKTDFTSEDCIYLGRAI